MLPASLASRCTLFPSRDAWLGARLATIGASEVAPILGLSPFRSPWDVWMAKRLDGHLEDEDAAIDDDPDAEDEDEPRIRGQVWEPWVRARRAAALRTEVVSPGAPWTRPDDLVVVHHPLRALSWATCSPDGWLWDEGVLTVPELKTDATRGGKWPRSGIDILGRLDDEADSPIRPDYLLQCVWQLETLDLPHLILGVLLGSYRTRYYRIRRDRDFGRRLINAVADWRDAHLLWGDEPDPDASEMCVAHFRARYLGRAHGDRVVEDPAHIALLRTYGNATATAKTARKIADTVRARTIEIVGDSARVRLPTGESLTRRSDGAITVHGFAAPKQLGETIAKLRPRLAPAAERVPDVEIDAVDVDFSEGSDAPHSKAS